MLSRSFTKFDPIVPEAPIMSALNGLGSKLTKFLRVLMKLGFSKTLSQNGSERTLLNLSLKQILYLLAMLGVVCTYEYIQ